MENRPIIYHLDDEISFRKCTLYYGERVHFGDCTDFKCSYSKIYKCNNFGIHYQCSKHPQFEYNIITSYDEFGYTQKRLECPICKKELYRDLSELRKQCLRLLNVEKFKNAKIIRLEDFCGSE